MTSAPTNRHTLLVVDDEPAILNSLRRLLQDTYEILTTSSVEEAFNLLEAHPVQLVMSDQRMPDMSGVEFLTFVKECYPDCVRILFTGYTDNQSAIEAINSGKVYCYVPKPWDPEELRLLLGQAAERYDLAQERKHLMARLSETNNTLERRNRDLEIANQKLQELDKLKTIFMEVASHELNTPISIVQGYTFLLRRELQDTEDPIMRRAVRGIYTSAQRLERITDKILTVLKSQTPQVNLNPEEVSLHDLLHGVEELVTPFIQKRNQTLEIRSPRDLRATLDVQLITDALVNLAMNAIKFSPDRHTITIAASLQGDLVRLDVIDRGVGVRPEDLPRIFQTFFGTFDSKHHSSGDFEFEKRGLGLGLAIVKKFAALHGGSVTVATERHGGSTFSLHLPLTPQPPRR